MNIKLQHKEKRFSIYYGKSNYKTDYRDGKPRL